MNKNKFSQLKQKISDFPLWIKEVLYIDIEKNIKALVGEYGMFSSEDEIFQYSCPKMTYNGRQELVNRNHSHHKSLYVFLSLLDKKYSIIEIMLEKVWTLEEVAKLYIMAFELGYVENLPTKKAETAALYFASKIRVGEYLKKIGKINFNQLEYAVKKQRDYLKKDVKKMMGEILIEQGYVEAKDLKSILKLKDESRKRFDLNLDFSSSIDAKAELEQRIEKLKKENSVLKNKLRAYIEEETV